MRNTYIKPNFLYFLIFLNIVPLARDSHNRAARDSHNNHHSDPIIIIIIFLEPKIAKISQPMVYTSAGRFVAIKGG